MNKHTIHEFPQVVCSILPTPFHRLNRMSDLLGIHCYCKRDDLTGFALGGNKTRKLDFLIGEAIAMGTTTIVTTGAIQSNFCRMTAAAGKVNGLKVHLVLGGQPPARPAGNYLLDLLFGATIHYCNSQDWAIWEEESERVAARLSAEGEKVYRLPVGGSTPTGALGYVGCFHELMADTGRSGIEIRKIIHATSSGGTQSGLIVGKAQTGWHGSIIGMGVAKSSGQLQKEIRSLAVRTGELLNTRIDPEDVLVDQRAMGPAYGAPTAGCDEAISLFAATEGIILDRVYTGKAAAGLIAMARSGEITSDENVVFLHTGGSMELFS